MDTSENKYEMPGKCWNAVLEKAGEDRLRHATEGKVEGRTEVTERPDPALKKNSGSPAKDLFFF